jgi:hypothetical protein
MWICIKLWTVEPLNRERVGEEDRERRASPMAKSEPRAANGKAAIVTDSVARKSAGRHASAIEYD